MGNPSPPVLHSALKYGSFLFKIAYDAAFAKYSPGTLLEMENMLHADRGPDRWESLRAAAGDRLSGGGYQCIAGRSRISQSAPVRSKVISSSRGAIA
jgi:hypothetical protein